MIAKSEGPAKVFIGMRLENALFKDVRLASASFENVSLAGARFDDIDFSNDRTVSFILSAFGIDTIRYASQPGWDEYFGAGRANAHHAVRHSPK